MRRWAELTSFLIGAAAALVLLAGWRVPDGGGQLGADLTLSIGRSSDVQLSRTGTVLDARWLRPGRTVRTEVVLHNPGRTTLRLKPRLQVASGLALARLLRVRVQADGAQLYAGTLAGLTRSAAPLRVRPGRSVRVVVALGLGPDVEDGYGGRTVRASLVFRAGS